MTQTGNVSGIRCLRMMSGRIAAWHEQGMEVVCTASQIMESGVDLCVKEVAKISGSP